MSRRKRRQSSHELIGAVDVGASKAVCLIARLVEAADGAPAPEIIGVGLQGMRAGERAAGRLAAAETALRGALAAAERMAGERLRAAVAAAPGRRLSCRRIGVDLDIEGGRVTREDMRDCLAEGAKAAAAEGARAIHALPARYSVDGEDAGPDPSGVAGAVLTTEVVGVGAREPDLVNLEALLGRCGLETEGFVAAPYAAAEAVLTDDEKDLGVILIDIGAGATDYAVFERGALVDCGGIALGGGHITRDIAQIFGAPLREAERMKTLYGSALAGVGDEHRLIDFPQIGEEGVKLRVARAELTAVIQPRLEEIFELALARLPAAIRAGRGPRRAALTGGGALLVGARETAERVLGLRTRLGRPFALDGAPEAATGPQFSVCAGAIRLAARKGAGLDDLAGDGQFETVGAGGLFGGVADWLRRNF
ncbi:cell division protein FtsA [Amphiplicatus metriothermophilus]|uniref:Cell division protein FtsA n=1 Tax=Amphiplicatus metriothermophilus TaxID=1519374 RepID=A0A239PT81_9PROT|nr:cell division protein FtsA [Amphiplicatus metriothermophilus]MBB5519259.1 cell division protein FtsA [Amphiplicatus metriothermophilus]SNT73328.1 cell division protein FtsA [Amphiplicatus metriothermophilus]